LCWKSAGSFLIARSGTGLFFLEENMEASTLYIVEIIKKHQAWIKNEEGGERANLDGASLWGVASNLPRIV